MKLQSVGHLRNREEQGKHIAQTSGAISMIDDSHYSVRSRSGFIHTTSLQPNADGFVRVQIMLATMPSASMYMQWNSIAGEMR